MKKLLMAAIIVLLTSCSQPSPTPIPSSSQVPPTTCRPTDQDQYIYHPDRLSVQAACIRITGEVLAVIHEADGDAHIRVLLDSQYTNLLTPANQQQCAYASATATTKTCGLLVVEPVCFYQPTQTDAIPVCAQDADISPGSLPSVGMHVWMEGRYVFDLDHGGWAELHPLYRWGLDQ